MPDLSSVLVETGSVVDVELRGNRELLHVDYLRQHVQHYQVVLVDVLAQRVQQVSCFLLELAVRSQDQEDVEPDLLVENRG